MILVPKHIKFEPQDAKEEVYTSISITAERGLSRVIEGIGLDFMNHTLSLIEHSIDDHYLICKIVVQVGDKQVEYFEDFITQESATRIMNELGEVNQNEKNNTES